MNPVQQARQILNGFEFGTLNVQETAQIGFLKTPGQEYPSGIASTCFSAMS